MSLSDAKLRRTNQKSTVAYNIYIFDNCPRSEIHDKTTATSATPNKPNIFLSKIVVDMTSIHAAAFNEDKRTPGLGTVGTNVNASQIHVCD